MVKKALAVLALTTGVVLSGSALAEPSRFDGSWSVQLVADGGLLCRSGTSQTLTVQNGSVASGRFWGERLRPSRAERVGQPCPAARRGPRLGLGQAVGLFGLRELGGVDAGVLRALDDAAPDPHRSGELKRPGSGGQAPPRASTPHARSPGKSK